MSDADNSKSVLTSETLADAGAAIRRAGLGVQLVLSWDACAVSPAELREHQVTPNHVLYNLGGEPLFGDGAPMHDEGFLDTSLEDIAAHLSEEQVADVTRAFGSVQTWARRQQPGLLGAANTVVIDGESGYFPPGPQRGRLVWGQRTADRHVVTADCVDFFSLRYGLTRARRTICLTAAGIGWIVDDYRSTREHDFAWQAYLRRGCTLEDASLVLRLPSGRAATLGWSGAEAAGLHRFPTYPAPSSAEGLRWPDAGSERLRLSTRAREARFAVCIVPEAVGELRVRRLGPAEWQADWAGGQSNFHSPRESERE